MVYKKITGLILLLLLGACTTTHSPAQDVVIQINLTIQGKPTNIVLPFVIKKGFLDKENEGINWISKEKFKELERNEKQRFNRKNKEAYNK